MFATITFMISRTLPYLSYSCLTNLRKKLRRGNQLFWGCLVVEAGIQITFLLEYDSWLDSEHWEDNSFLASLKVIFLGVQALVSFLFLLFVVRLSKTSMPLMSSAPLAALSIFLCSLFRCGLRSYYAATNTMFKFEEQQRLFGLPNSTVDPWIIGLAPDLVEVCSVLMLVYFDTRSTVSCCPGGGGDGGDGGDGCGLFAWCWCCHGKARQKSFGASYDRLDTHGDDQEHGHEHEHGETDDADRLLQAEAGGKMDESLLDHEGGAWAGRERQRQRQREREREREESGEAGTKGGREEGGEEQSRATMVEDSLPAERAFAADAVDDDAAGGSTFSSRTTTTGTAGSRLSLRRTTMSSGAIRATVGHSLSGSFVVDLDMVYDSNTYNGSLNHANSIASAYGGSGYTRRSERPPAGVGMVGGASVPTHRKTVGVAPSPPGSGHKRASGAVGSVAGRSGSV